MEILGSIYFLKQYFTETVYESLALEQYDSGRGLPTNASPITLVANQAIPAWEVNSFSCVNAFFYPNHVS